MARKGTQAIVVVTVAVEVTDTLPDVVEVGEIVTVVVVQAVVDAAVAVVVELAVVDVVVAAAVVVVVAAVVVVVPVVNDSVVGALVVVAVVVDWYAGAAATPLTFADPRPRNENAATHPIETRMVQIARSRCTRMSPS